MRIGHPICSAWSENSTPAEHKRGFFTVHAIHEDVPFDGEIKDGVFHEIEELAGWLRLDLAGI